MEIVRRESVNISNSVVVRGLTGTDSDEEVATYLQKYGSIRRHLRIDDPKSDFHDHTIVEFTHLTAMQVLEPTLPLKFPSPTQANIVYELRSLASVYTLEARSRATRCYLEQLGDIARLSGQTVEQLLKEELVGIASAVTPPSSPQPRTSPLLELSTTPPTEPLEPPNVSSSPCSRAVSSDEHAPLTSGKNLINLTSALTSSSPTAGAIQALVDITPPSVQRVVVEHVVRGGGTPTHFATIGRLRVFSGRSPCPNNEVDYDTWRTSVEVLMKDSALSDLHRTQRILDSLLSPAAEVVKHLGLQANSSDYIGLLDSAYGTVEDGDELYARFMSTLQNDGEKPSTFLQRLHVALSTAMRRGGVSPKDFDQQILKQFCRGCWESALIVDLQLEQRKENPPSFAEFLLLLRTEEDKQAAKLSRMKQHLGVVKPSGGVTKQRVMSHLQTAHHSGDNNGTELTELRKQLAELSAQLSSITAKPQEIPLLKHKKGRVVVPSAKAGTPTLSRRTSTPQHSWEKTNGKPRPWYCFQCGEDGHIASKCDNDPNPLLVAAKKKQLREKQAKWETSPAGGGKTHLN